MNRQAEQLRKAREAMRSGEEITPSDFVKQDTNLPKTDIYDNAEGEIPVAKEKSSGVADLLEMPDKYKVIGEKVGAIYQDGEWGPAIQYSRLEDDDYDDSSFDGAIEFD